MTEADIHRVVVAVLEAERARDRPVDEVVEKVVTRVLQSLGIREEDADELAADFRHLRRWRKSVEEAQSLTFKAVVTIIATGIAGALWLGFKTAIALTGKS